MRKKSRGGAVDVRSPVAKHAYKFNRCIVIADRKKYRRAEKHKGSEPFPSLFALLIGRQSCERLSV